MKAALAGWLLGALLASGLSQAPAFVDQYAQRLGGTVDALAGVVGRFDADAARSGYDRSQALAAYRRAGDAFLARRGRSMAALIRRYERLERASRALARAQGVWRVAVFAGDHDDALVRATARDFRPALPLTVAGGWMCLLGLLGGRLVVAAFAGAARRRPRPA